VHRAPLDYPIRRHARRLERVGVSLVPAAGQYGDMDTRAAITVLRDRDELRRLWGDRLGDATVTFKDAPGERGTEVHVDLGQHGGPVRRFRRSARLADAKDELRRFKQHVETGVIARSER
jgi:hypothetical protein